MSKITHEQARERKQNIITKQIALSSDIYSVRLIPISADETNIKEIQDFIDKQEKLLELYRKLITVKNEIISLLIRNEEYDEKEVIEIDLEKQIKEFNE